MILKTTTNQTELNPDQTEAFLDTQLASEVPGLHHKDGCRASA